MGQYEIKRVLKDNPNTFLSARQVAELMGVSVQSVTKCLSKLIKDSDVNYKTIIGKSNSPIRVYQYTQTDDHFDQALHEFQILKNDQRMQTTNSDTIRQFQLIAELKKLNEGLKK